MIGQMAVLTALHDLGRSVTPTFLCKHVLYLQLSPPCPKMNKKLMWEVKKNPRFLFTGHRILLSCSGKERETMVAKHTYTEFTKQVLTT